MSAETTDQAQGHHAEETQVIRGPEAMRDRIAELCEHAHTEVVVWAPQFDPNVFNSSQLCDALIRFVVRSRQNRVRLLTKDPDQLRRDNERLIDVARRMSDFVEVRQLADEDAGYNDLFVCVDHRRYLHQLDIERPECVAAEERPVDARELAARFEDCWNRATPFGAVRTLGL